MKILFVCHRLITFILNEIVELEKLGNDVSILSVHRDPSIYNQIVLPMLREHGLSHKIFIDFTPRNKGFRLLYDMFCALVQDMARHPVRTIKCIYLLLKIYNKYGIGINCYLDTRPLLDQKFDVIHSPFSTPDNIKRVYYLSRILNVPYTLSFRAHDIYGGFEESIKEKQYIVDAANIFLSASYYKRLIEEKLDYGKAIDVVHGGVDTDFFQPNGHKKRGNSLVSVCRFHEVKGILYLLEACKILHERNIPYQYDLIGGGPEEETYRAFIRENQIPNVSIINFLDRGGVKNALSTSELFVLPCIVLEDGTHDILPNSVKEAMSMELPVITSDITGIRELIDHNEDGILIPDRDPVAIADSIEWLLENREKMHVMGRKAREKILKEYSVKAEAKKLDQIFESSLKHG